MNRTGIFPKRLEVVVFSFFLSLLMTFIVSGVSTLRTFGFGDTFLSVWAANFVSSWPVAFPAVLVAAPLVRRLVAKLIKQDAPVKPEAS